MVKKNVVKAAEVTVSMDQAEVLGSYVFVSTGANLSKDFCSGNWNMGLRVPLLPEEIGDPKKAIERVTKMECEIMASGFGNVFGSIFDYIAKTKAELSTKR